MSYRVKQPCAVCRNHKPLKPFKIRDDNGTLFNVTHICNCPYCGRFLEENYEKEVLKMKKTTEKEWRTWRLAQTYTKTLGMHC